MNRKKGKIKNKEKEHERQKKLHFTRKSTANY